MLNILEGLLQRSQCLVKNVFGGIVRSNIKEDALDNVARINSSIDKVNSAGTTSGTFEDHVVGDVGAAISGEIATMQVDHTKLESVEQLRSQQPIEAHGNAEYMLVRSDQRLDIFQRHAWNVLFDPKRIDTWFW
jgi:hypothetical protein